MQNLDFYKELNNTVEDEKIGENENICLITHVKLEDTCIKLNCGHSFNYAPLYNECRNQKYNFVNSKNYYNSSNKLHTWQIMCPYCRNVQNNLLPCIESKNTPLLKGVNTPIKYCMYLNKCNYIYKSGKNKGITCSKPCNEEKCKTHMKTKHTSEKKKCCAILKSGKNKGNQCSNNACANSDFCKRHQI